MSPGPSSIWLVTCAALIAPLAICAFVCTRGAPGARLAGLELTSVVMCLLFVAYARAERHAVFMDLPVAMALLTFGGSLVFARFLERYL